MMFSSKMNVVMDEVEQTATEVIIMHYVAPPPAGNHLEALRKVFAEEKAAVQMAYERFKIKRKK